MWLNYGRFIPCKNKLDRQKINQMNKSLKMLKTDSY